MLLSSYHAQDHTSINGSSLINLLINVVIAYIYDIGSSPDETYGACVGENATRSCFKTISVIGDVVWRKDGIVITDSTPGYAILQGPSSSTLATILVVHNVTLDDDGTYTCSIAITTICKMALKVFGGMHA